MMMSRTQFSKALIVLGLVASVSFAATPLVAAQQGPVQFPQGVDVVATSPVDTDLRIAAAGSQLFRSEDGGQTWVAFSEAPGTVTALAPGNADANLLYAGTESGGVLRSLDGGMTWQSVNEGLGLLPGTQLGVSALAVDQANDTWLYAATGYWLGTTQVRFSPAAVAFSTDGGANWLPLAELPLGSEPITQLVPQAGQPLAVQVVSASGAAQALAVDATAMAEILASGEAPVARRAAAAQALGILGDPQAVPALVSALSADDAALVARAAGALGALQASAAVPALRDVLMDPQVVAPAAAADALSAIGSPEAMDALLGALDSETMTPARHNAMAALERLGSPAVTDLQRLVANGSPAAQRNAIEALGWIGDPAAVDSLLAALRYGTGDVRAEAAWALGEIGDPKAIPALAAAAAEDANTDVRLVAAQALNRLPEPPAVVAAPELPAPAESTVVLAPGATGQAAQPAGLPGWLRNATPLLRYLILGLVLAAAALLPWYQNLRENRSHK